MEITIRKMQSAEARTVKALGRKSFSFFESLWVSSPKTAFVAVIDGEIVGALLYKMMALKNQKVGYVDYLFTDPSHQGKGIGRALCGEAIAFLQNEGCMAITALVKDDNVASWSLFTRNGFERVSIPRLVKEFGIVGALKQYFLFPFFIGIGMDYYVLMPEHNAASHKENSALQIAAFLLTNAVIGIVMLPKWPGALMYALFYVGLLCLQTASGWLGTLLSKQKWRFRFINGGGALSLAVNLFAILPMIGRWYPIEYENAKTFRKDMGITELISWASVLIVSAILVFLAGTIAHFRSIGQFTCILALYRCIPVYPFEGFGGKRVWDWNKPVFAVLAVLSVLLFCWSTFA